MAFMEHRFGTRVTMDAPVGLVRRGAEIPVRYVGRLIELSLSGALIETELELGRWMRADIWLSSSWVPAFVIRSLPRGLAIEWCHMAPPAVRALLRSARETV